MTPRFGVSLVVAGGLLIAGCGAGKPEDVAVSYVATNAASKCDLLTQALVEQLTRRQGAAARAACRRNVVRFRAPEHVKVRRVVGGDEDEGEEREPAGGVEAESEVELVADGHEAEVRLVKQHEHWQIAALGE
jgi:hypothetical protein